MAPARPSTTDRTSSPAPAAAVPALGPRPVASVIVGRGCSHPLPPIAPNPVRGPLRPPGLERPRPPSSGTSPPQLHPRLERRPASVGSIPPLRRTKCTHADALFSLATFRPWWRRRATAVLRSSTCRPPLHRFRKTTAPPPRRRGTSPFSPWSTGTSLGCRFFSVDLAGHQGAARRTSPVRCSVVQAFATVWVRPTRRLVGRPSTSRLNYWTLALHGERRAPSPRTFPVLSRIRKRPPSWPFSPALQRVPSPMAVALGRRRPNNAGVWPWTRPPEERVIAWGPLGQRSDLARGAGRRRCGRVPSQVLPRALVERRHHPLHGLTSLQLPLRRGARSR